MTDSEETYSSPGMPPEAHKFTEEEMQSLCELGEMLAAIHERLRAEGKDFIQEQRQKKKEPQWVLL
jgi:Ser/Thr protein kinase RdoA (MazF antagonist)